MKTIKEDFLCTPNEWKIQEIAYKINEDIKKLLLDKSLKANCKNFRCYWLKSTAYNFDDYIYKINGCNL